MDGCHMSSFVRELLNLLMPYSLLSRPCLNACCVVEAEWAEKDPKTGEETEFSGVWVARRISAPLYYAVPQVKYCQQCFEYGKSPTNLSFS